ncbi:GlcG/HbpS family heme-binding protein [Neptunomonas phycophila]|jgi:glc operon protein GlcG|uniref:GlcG/HbpS family heme-binding protein n=1 Tax=Neptunomonas phycophila TaxID=1572645 RepID=UPI00351606A4
MIKIGSIIFSLMLLNQMSYCEENRPRLDFPTAEKIKQGCLSYAQNHKLNLAIAIYDSHGNLISFSRMDGASVGVSEIARWKGKSSAIYQFPTSEMKQWNIPSGPYIAPVAGGIPINSSTGVIIGAIGVSGADSLADVACAKAGVSSAMK